MKVNDIVLVKPLIDKIASMEMNARTALSFAKWAREALMIIQEFEVKRSGFFEKYGEKQEDGNFKIKEENEKKFKTAITKALNKDVGLEPFNISDSGITIPPADLINVMPLFI
jgi:hypothetical protein